MQVLQKCACVSAVHLRVMELERERQVELMTERLQILLLILCRALAGLGEDEGRKRLRELEKEPAGLAVRLSARRALEEAGKKERKTDKIW